MSEPSPNDTSTQIEQRLAELPQDVQDAVLSAQLGERVREIGQKHALHIDQIGVLEDETMLVMLGFFEPERFSGQIATQLNIPAADADVVAQEVSEKIFLPIRESMKRFAESKKTGVQAKTLAITPEHEEHLPIQVVTEPVQAKPLVVSTPPMPNAEKMLTEATVAKPIYKNDPYREPIES